MPEPTPAPSVDRRQLQQIIAGLTEGVILVEPYERITWANATALMLHGVSELADLGSTVAGYQERFSLRYRNQHKLAADEYPIARGVAGEAFSDVVVEVATRGTEEWRTHQIRALILTDAEERLDCLVLVINDETERFNAEERFEKAFAANPAPAIIARLSDMRYVKVNRGFQELTGLRRDDLIGRSVHKFDVLRDAERRNLAVQRLHAGETIPQMEACLLLPSGAERTVLLGGQPIEIGDQACMLFTFADLHPRHEAEHALKHSETRFSTMFHMAPGPMAIFALDGLRFLDVNTAFTAATGWRREEVVGRGETEIELWTQPGLGDGLQRQLIETGRIASVDVQVRSKTGVVGDYLLSAETVEMNGRPCVVSLMLDITERKQTENELLAAIQSVMQDTSWIGQKVVEKLNSITRVGGATGGGPELADLSQRARDVLDRLAAGSSDAEVAIELQISINTVRNHVSAIFKKIGVRNRSALVVWARERGVGASNRATSVTSRPKAN